MCDQPILKHRPDDFLVRENLVVRLVPPDKATQHYLLLRKCGYTTIEAVQLIANKLGLPSEDVTYGGLKDEDAITEQMVAVPVDVVPTDMRTASWLLTQEPHRWLELQHHGFGVDPPL